jgi:hypothetical protein
VCFYIGSSQPQIGSAVMFECSICVAVFMLVVVALVGLGIVTQ